MVDVFSHTYLYDTLSCPGTPYIVLVYEKIVNCKVTFNFSFIELPVLNEKEEREAELIIDIFGMNTV